MFDIHLAYYRNIGPFQNQDIFVNYKSGRNLIKAPIGVGKSFLFFDAPIFALYKTSSRTITNKNCKNSHLQLLFTVNDKTFLIIRDLTLTAKGKDSVKTKLFTVESNNDLTSYLQLFATQAIVQKKGDILTDMTFHNLKVEEISANFKTDAELQGNLNDFLPPKEVVLSTFFLMQDADNIFQSTPAERIQILKKIFGLIGIDEAKDIINDEKKILLGQLKAKEDIGTYQEKIDEKINSMKELQKKIGFSSEKLGFENIGEGYKFDINKLTSINIDLSSEKKELEKAKNQILSIKEKLKIQEEIKTNKEKEYRETEEQIQIMENENRQIIDKIKTFDPQIEDNLKAEKMKLQQEIKTIKSLYSDINKLYEKYQNLQEKKKNLLEQKENINEKILTYKQNTQILQEKIDNIQKEINQISNVDMEELSQKKMDLVSQKEKIVQNIDFSSIKLESLDSPDNIASLEKFIGEVETIGKSYKADISNINIEIEEITNDIRSLKNDMDIKIKQLESNKEGIEDYFCEKIKGNCPYVDEIKGGVLKKQQENLQIDIENIKTKLKSKEEKKAEKEKHLVFLENKRVELLEFWKKHNLSGLKGKILEYHNITIEIEKLDKKFVDIQKIQKLENEKGNLAGQMQQIETQIADTEKQKLKLEQNIENLMQESSELGGEKLILDYQALIENNRKIEDLNEKLDDFAKSKANLQKLQLKQEKLLYKIQEKQKILEKIQQEIEKANVLCEELELKIQEQDIDKLQNIERDIQEFEKTVALYNNIIEEFSNNKALIIDLKAKIKRLKDLYDLFSKELVIIVFMSYLKQLEEVLNSILANMVDFTLLFDPDDKGKNLEIQAVDDKGTRLVQSLSGGQKNIIRLAWILAVSTFQDAKILFLDETVNNLDKESIGKVAQFIQEFLDKNDMKFYMITHSSQLQGLDIWDNVEELDALG